MRGNRKPKKCRSHTNPVLRRFLTIMLFPQQTHATCSLSHHVSSRYIFSRRVVRVKIYARGCRIYWEDMKLAE